VVSLPALQALAVSFAPEAKGGNSRSVSGRQRLKIVGKAISCPGPGTATSRKIANKDTQTFIRALIKRAKTLPNELYKSLTWDRGKELTDHRRFTLATNIDVTSAIRKVRGSAVPMKIPIAC
jgi:hypothetical protein